MFFPSRMARAVSRSARSCGSASVIVKRTFPVGDFGLFATAARAVSSGERPVLFVGGFARE
jgi:hypothetical protein